MLSRMSLIVPVLCAQIVFAAPATPTAATAGPTGKELCSYAPASEVAAVFGGNQFKTTPSGPRGFEPWSGVHATATHCLFGNATLAVEITLSQYETVQDAAKVLQTCYDQTHSDEPGFHGDIVVHAEWVQGIGDQALLDERGYNRYFVRKGAKVVIIDEIPNVEGRPVAPFEVLKPKLLQLTRSVVSHF